MVRASSIDRALRIPVKWGTGSVGVGQQYRFVSSEPSPTRMFNTRNGLRAPVVPELLPHLDRNPHAFAPFLVLRHMRRRLAGQFNINHNFTEKCRYVCKWIG
jgi:hypothetical protein